MMTAENLGGDVADPYPLPPMCRGGHLQTLSPAEQEAYWAFHKDRRKPFMERAYVELGSDADAEEAVDETFLYLESRWGEVMAMANPRAYAAKVLGSKIVDQFRRRTRATSFGNAVFDAAARSWDPMAGLPLIFTLFSALPRLPLRQREAFIWADILDYATRDVAEILGVSESTIRTQLSDARRRLTAMLQDADEVTRHD